MPSPTVLRRLALAGAATGVAALAGCSAVTTSGFDPTAVQPSPLAAVDLSQQFCADTDGTREAGEVCAPFVGYDSYPGNSVTFTSAGSGRLLVLAQVADGAPDPVFRLRRTPDAPLVRDDALVPPSTTVREDGYHWVGYRSAIVTYAPGERDPGDLVEASVPVQPLAARSSVFSVGVGVQVIQDGLGKDYGDRPVVCDEHLEGDSDIDSITCPGFNRGTGRETGLATTDAQVSAPQGAAAADAGTTAKLDFAVEQAGTVAEASALRVDASTTVAGGSATTGATEIPWAVTPEPPAEPDPGDGDGGTIQDRRAQEPTVDEAGVARTPVTVAVAVPDATPTGDYAVTLRVRDTAGAERTATANLRVTGKPVVPAPAATPAAPAAAAPTAVLSTLKATKVNATRRRVHAGRVTCRSTTRCIVSTVVRAGTKRVGFLRFVLKPGASGPVSLRLSRPATALLAKRGGTITVSVDAGGPKTLVRVTKLAVQRG